MERQVLQSLGLTDSEAKVYLALLELGSSSQGPIVERAKVASSKVYGLLDKLIAKGLASYVIRSGVKWFEAAPPGRLLDYLRARERDLEVQREALQQLLPLLEERRGQAFRGTEAQIFKGLEGATTAFNDILREMKRGSEYHVLGVSELPARFEKWALKFHRTRAKQGIRCKIVVNELARDLGEKFAAIPLTKVRYVSKELFTPVVFATYNDTTLISISLDELWIQVKSRNLAEGLRVYSSHMWDISKEN